jgi:hypothetical protein
MRQGREQQLQHKDMRLGQTPDQARGTRARVRTPSAGAPPRGHRLQVAPGGAQAASPTTSKARAAVGPAARHQGAGGAGAVSLPTGAEARAAGRPAARLRGLAAGGAHAMSPFTA